MERIKYLITGMFYFMDDDLDEQMEPFKLMVVANCTTASRHKAKGIAEKLFHLQHFGYQLCDVAIETIHVHI
jgi:hypothetical protein